MDAVCVHKAGLQKEFLCFKNNFIQLHFVAHTVGKLKAFSASWSRAFKREANHRLLFHTTVM
jgi:hypothetical protein